MWNDDLCSDWAEAGEEYTSQFPRAADESGWGIDESMYTTAIDSSLTPEQRAMADRIAAEIEAEQRSKQQKGGARGGAPAGPFQGVAPASYAESQAGSFFQKQKATLPPKPPGAAKPLQAAPDNYTQAPPGRAGPSVTAPAQQFTNECKVVTWLQEEINRVLTLIGTLGDPRPDQAAKLLNEYTASVTTMIPFSPPEVKSAVIASFKKCNWDVLRRLPTPGSRPPDGKTLCDLIFELGTFFCARTNQQGPPAGFVDMKLAEHHAKRRATQQATQQPAGGGGGGYGKTPAIPSAVGSRPNSKGGNTGKGKGKGYQGNNDGKGGGKGYQGGKGGSAGGKGGYGGKGGSGPGKGAGGKGKGGGSTTPRA